MLCRINSHTNHSACIQVLDFCTNMKNRLLFPRMNVRVGIWWLYLQVNNNFTVDLIKMIMIMTITITMMVVIIIVAVININYIALNQMSFAIILSITRDAFEQKS